MDFPPQLARLTSNLDGSTIQGVRHSQEYHALDTSYSLPQDQRERQTNDDFLFRGEYPVGILTRMPTTMHA
ncbi:hypothetical protein A5652_00265 [Mycobacterium sp. 1165178.9]|nr:hypothetical protein A5652_00265 [Mycobacterium sp. 1165178.9]